MKEEFILTEDQMNLLLEDLESHTTLVYYDIMAVILMVFKFEKFKNCYEYEAKVRKFCKRLENS